MLGNTGFESRKGKEILLLPTTSRPALRPTQTPIRQASATLSTGIKRAGREAIHSSLSNIEIKNEWKNNYTPPIYLHSLDRGLFYILKVQLSLRQILTYLLTPWSRVLLEKLTGSAASKEIPRIFGTRRFITVLTSARRLSLS